MRPGNKLQTYIHTYVHTYVPIYIYTYIHTYIYTYMHVPTYIHKGGKVRVPLNFVEQMVASLLLNKQIKKTLGKD